MDAVADRPSVIVTCVHGTWARGSRWPDVEKAVTQALWDFGPIEIRYFQWSGRNSLAHRLRAADDLRQQFLQDTSRSPGTLHFLVAHSHGANVVLHALDEAPPTAKEALAGIVLLSPPLLNCRLVARPGAAANQLLVGALAVVPLFLMAAGTIHRALEWPMLAALPIATLLIAPWLALFRPSRVQRRAELLARQLALPQIDVPGLIIRAAGDKAPWRSGRRCRPAVSLVISWRRP